MNNIILFFIFILGCSIGSFLNVIIYRLPLNKSIIISRSECIKCKYNISWFDNIPILSWFILLGRCRRCKSKIPIKYPFIEFCTGVIFLLNLYSSPTHFREISIIFTSFFGFFLSSIFILLSIFDLQYLWLPSLITNCGILFGLITSLIVDLSYNFPEVIFLKSSFTGALIGYLIFYLLSFIGKIIFNKPVLGGGDSKLSALIGSWLGLKGLLVSIWLAFNSAGIFVIIGLLLKIIVKDQKIPFGIFLCSSAFLVWHFGYDNIIQIIDYFL